MTTMTTLIPLAKADFDTYCAIESLVFDVYAEEVDMSFEEIVAFAADLGVDFTSWDMISLGIDYDEM